MGQNHAQQREQRLREREYAVAGGQNPRVISGDGISCHLHALSDLGTCNMEIFLLSSWADSKRIYLRFIMPLAL